MGNLKCISYVFSMSIFNITSLLEAVARRLFQGPQAFKQYIACEIRLLP